MNGYSFPTDPESWAGLRERFEWDVPEEYNIAGAILEGDQNEAESGGRADRTALVHTDAGSDRHALTYGDLDRASAAVAAWLADRGIGRGDAVALCLPQCPELLVAYLAVFRLGAVAVPRSMLLGGEALVETVERSGADLLVIDAWKADAVEGTHSAETVVIDPGRDGYARPRGRLPGDEEALGERDEVGPVGTRPDERALVLFTSGTTGRPSGVVQGHQYLLGSLPGYQCYFELFDPADAREARVWSPSEWTWAGALFDVLLPTLALGGTVVSRARYSGFDPERALALVERERVTHAFLPPTALSKLRAGADPAEYDLDSLVAIQSGGEKLAPALLEWGQRALACTINEAYGQTEANALVGNCQALFDPKEGSMGRAYPGHEVVVLDGDTATACERGELGEIAVQRPDPVVFEGYLDDPEGTAERFRGDYFLTGDAATRDEEGYFYHRGRTDDLLLRSGYRISPLEIETALTDHPAVREAVVGGVTSGERQRVKAYVVLADEAEEGAGERADLLERLEEHVRERAGAHKVPDDIEIIGELPTTTSDKTDRAALFDGE
ncbi:MAG: acyl-CoA synthetase [Haloarculaceae archaeon]